MKTIQVKRITSLEDGVFGVLLINEKPICVTLELPWKNNERRISCIPAGTYTCIRRYSPHLGHETFGLLEVPNRSDILIHSASLKKDLLGCIGVAEFFKDFSGQTGIANPYKGAAFEELMKNFVGENNCQLIITEHF